MIWMRLLVLLDATVQKRRIYVIISFILYILVKKLQKEHCKLKFNFLTTTSSRSSPLVPCRIFTKFPILFSHMYNACCLADPAQTYSPSPEKQHFFHIVLFTRSCSFCIGSGSPSLPHANISVLSYTRITLSDVLTRKQEPRRANSILFTAVLLAVPCEIL